MMKNLALALCVLVAVFAAGSCTVSDPEEKHLISILVPDSLKAFDEMRILLLDPVTRDTLDTLWNAPYSDSAQLTGLSAKRYAGGPVEVVIQGWRAGKLELAIRVRYQADGSKPKTETLFTKRIIPETAPDTVKPILSLTGPDSVKMEQGGRYADLGAHCRDGRDGDLPVITTGAVDEAAIGIHTLRFDCADSAGNKASAITRRVHVVPVRIPVPPTLVLLGHDSAWIPEKREYLDSGAICKDENGRDLPFSAKGDVNTLIRGQYRVEFSCADSTGIPAPDRVRIINVIREPDTVPPILTLMGPDTVESGEGREYRDPGAACDDVRDGNLPVTQAGDSVDILGRGEYRRVYACSDSAGNAAPAKIRVIRITRLADPVRPVLTLRGRDSLEVWQGIPYSDSGAVCEDDRDGNLPVTLEGAVDVQVRGAHTLRYRCADSAGNAAEGRTRIVKVVRLPDAAKPQLFLRGPDSLIVYDKEAYADSGAVCIDDRDGTIAASVTGSVDPATRGLYALSFHCRDSAGNEAVVKIRKVKVIRVPDAVKPVLALAGPEAMDHLSGTPYMDSGAVCVDDRDGTLPVAVKGSVDPSAIGTYDLEFDCSDSAGNAAPRVKRTVRVVPAPDLVKPVLTLVGPDTLVTVNLDSFDNPGAVCVDDRDGALAATFKGFEPPAGPSGAPNDGIYRAVYACEDKSGNRAGIERVVKSGMYTVNLSAIQDTQIDTLQPWNNWGYTGVIAFSLHAWDNYFTFAKFDLSKVVKTGLKSAKLRYFTWGLGDTWPAQRGDYTFHIYALQSAWVEGTGNWFYHDGGVRNGGEEWLVHYHYPDWVKTGSTAPFESTGVTGGQIDLVRDRNITPLGTQKLNLNYGGHSAVPVVAPNRLVVVEVDVTEYVRNAVPAQDYGFMLKTEGTPGGRRIGWLTREMDDGQWAPRLMLSY